MSQRLQDKVAIVTGGSAGIGAAIVRRFVHPVRVEGGVHRTPREPGTSRDLKS